MDATGRRVKSPGSVDTWNGLPVSVIGWWIESVLSQAACTTGVEAKKRKAMRT